MALAGPPRSHENDCSQAYFHTSAWKVNSQKFNFRFTEFSEVALAVILPGGGLSATP